MARPSDYYIEFEDPEMLRAVIARFKRRYPDEDFAGDYDPADTWATEDVTTLEDARAARREAGAMANTKEQAMPMHDIIEETRRRREADAKRWADLANDRCQLCDAQGPDMRSLWMSCGYAVHEVIPEAIDTHNIEEISEGRRGQYYLKCCKSCRARFLSHLQQWRQQCVPIVI